MFRIIILGGDYLMAFNHSKQGGRRALSVVLCLLLVMTSLPIVMFGTAPEAAAAVTALTEFNVAAGGTISSGRYVVSSSRALNGSGSAGLYIASGATVLLYIPSGVTLTVTGAAGGNAGAGGNAQNANAGAANFQNQSAPKFEDLSDDEELPF